MDYNEGIAVSGKRELVFSYLAPNADKADYRTLLGVIREQGECPLRYVLTDTAGVLEK